MVQLHEKCQACLRLKTDPGYTVLAAMEVQMAKLLDASRIGDRHIHLLGTTNSRYVSDPLSAICWQVAADNGKSWFRKEPATQRVQNAVDCRCQRMKMSSLAGRELV